MAMNQEVKKQWVEALRSGEYRQGHGWLRSDHGFCCQGVLSDLYAKQTGKPWAEAANDNGVCAILGECHYWPCEVMVWAGIGNGANRDERANAVVITIDGESASLPTHNDAGRTFAEIADAIERQL